jgi:hypothetical protein
LFPTPVSPALRSLAFPEEKAKGVGAFVVDERPA